MTICDDLRQSVLQAAIQGKLTKQLPEDGTAADLLASIKDEKEKLVKEKKIKRENPLAPISADEIPFDIPENWEWVYMDDVIFSTDAGKSPQCQPRPKKEEEWGVIKTTAIQNGYFNPKENKVLPQGFHIKSSQIVKKGDLLITRASPRNRTGVLCVVQDEVKKLILSDKTIRFNYVAPYVDPYYVSMMLSSPAIQRNIEQYMTGMASSQVNISQKDMRKFIVALPPLAEQHRIVARVNELMAKIDELEAVEKELVALKKDFPGDMKASLLQAAMQGKLTQQLPEDGSTVDLLLSIKAEKEQLIKEKKIKKEKPLAPSSVDEIPFDIPDNWEWVHLEDIGRFGAGKTPDSDLISFYGKYPYFKVSDMNVAGNEKEMCVVKNWLGPEYSGTLFPKGSFIYPKNGGAVFTNKKRILVQDSLVDLNTGVYIPSNSVNQDFLFYLFSTLDFRHLYKGTALPTIDMDKVRSLIFPLPPLSEQQRIVEKLDKLLPLCDALKEDGVT